MATANIEVSETPLVLYALRRADDALILGHRLSEWCGHAPMLEEDMALSNIALDLIGQARELYTYAAKAEGGARAQVAIDHLWAFTGEMFAVDEGERALIHAGVAIDPGTMRSRWLTTLSDVISEATLVLPQSDWMQQGGRAGRHSEHLGHL